MSEWIRTCQECGYKQEDRKPDIAPLTKAYLNRKCKTCKSEALDFGSLKSDESDGIKELDFD